MEEASNILLTYFKTIIECIVILVPFLMELPLGFSYFIYIYFLLNNSKDKIDRPAYYEWINEYNFVYM